MYNGTGGLSAGIAGWVRGQLVAPKATGSTEDSSQKKLG